MMVCLDGNKVYEISSTSLRHILIFEKDTVDTEIAIQQTCGSNLTLSARLKLMFGRLSFTALIFACLIALCGCDGGISFEGKVLDENGKPVKGAKVVLISRGTKAERISRDDGSYDVGVIHAPVSPSGTLTVSKDGYQTIQQSFSSRDDLSRHRDIVLKPAAVPAVTK